ncbi:alpha/beta-hydrolase [Aspergillus aculeatinus CBS 121060]|uniref:Alpha/beta-hydrolase n=1 Tax=Aspergillus aculeatinus CBS 121060 TaxID=1448322 RepID=A0ACD1GZJ2_9EURO|nr:alpha/beta-hydrolase [Aspergillus aculeatinus CBS 121060]RAH66724.1 alpha/beta-hydrolase [Aspergillus aculeatinus CBS 121060]
MAPSPFFDLMNALTALDVDKFKSFNTITTPYKKLNGTNQSISTDIFIPRSILQQQQPRQCPIIVRIHGGFLITGSSQYAPWFSSWTFEYALASQSIIVSPNYRLLPEASGQDIIDDMEDFWRWLHSEQFMQSVAKAAGQSYLVPDRDRPSFSKVVLTLAISHPSEIRAVIGAYPMLDFKVPFYTDNYPKPIVGVPNVPNRVVDDHLLSTRETPAVITAADPPDRLRLAFAIVQNGRFLEFFGSPDDYGLFPMERIERLAAAGRLELPPLFVFHGEQDSAVPVDGTRRFVALLRQLSPTAQVDSIPRMETMVRARNTSKGALMAVILVVRDRYTPEIYLQTSGRQAGEINTRARLERGDIEAARTSFVIGICDGKSVAGTEYPHFSHSAQAFRREEAEGVRPVFRNTILSAYDH